MKTTINVRMTNHEGRQEQPYRGFSADITLDNGITKNVTTIHETNPVEFIEQALNEVVGIAVRDDFTPQDIVITVPSEVVMSTILQTNIADKLMVDSLINSVTFT